ncbi:hypothetical protein AAG570_009645 [Ranatra chinensis]|uniref:GTP-binding protein 10 n=1 Tax=Ranatra chinensis TaxID=642074 RepID=A0ABD0YPX7_9HEMI
MDSLRLLVKGGAGGMGFPKYGGLGGPGGNVCVVGKEGITLKDVLKTFKTKQVKAGNGENSHKNCILGEKGNDVIIEAPLGISLYDETGAKIGEVNREDDTVIIAHGGVGGCPETGHSGCRGQSRMVTFDLKLIADVGLVGFPNAGKSTLLSALSNARPKIASYPFTTLMPNIGTIKYPDLRQITVADLPGLIEGAHANLGMGHKFLKHVERTRLLLVVVDVGGFQLGPRYSARSCLETIVLLNKELELYREDLIHKPAILIINKMDKTGSREMYEYILEAMKDIKGVIQDTPEIFRPHNPLTFERIVGISAREKENSQIEEVKAHIKDVLDNTITKTIDEQLIVETLEKRLRTDCPLLI